ncbi:MAG TPA: prepilin-type N-terminal cleavage/methylation domain-containing protein [Syntrophales bacterium]|nr:prepilin-type N-terminal cleavage/methylation domain-containing protein [Syntrophales bacterium]
MKFRKKTAEKKMKNRGFTLIEVLIALFLLAVTLAGAAGLTAAIIRTNALNRQSTEALILAGDKMEELTSRLYPAVISGSDAPSLYGRTWIVDDGVPQEGMKTVTVTVTWSGFGSPRQVSLATVRSR